MEAGTFKQRVEFHKRAEESNRICRTYPNRVPVIVEPAIKCTVPIIDKNKYLVPADLTMGQFIYVIRKRIKLESEQGLFVFVNNILPSTSACITDVYEQYRDADGFLYVTYTGENTFGHPC